METLPNVTIFMTCSSEGKFRLISVLLEVGEGTVNWEDSSEF